MSFREKLIAIFYKAAKSSRRIRSLLTPVGASFFLSLIVIFIVASLQVDKFLELPKLLPTSLRVVVSMPILAVGLFLMLWSILHFMKVKGTPVPFNPPPKVVTTGPYAYVRNPMLIGIFILLLGFGALLQSVSLTFIFTPFLILLSVLELKGIEEPELERRLGKEYVEYKKRVPMFISTLRIRPKKRFAK